MVEGGGKAQNLEATPEVAPITSLLLHPILQAPKFLAAALAVFISILLFTGEYHFILEISPKNTYTKIGTDHHQFFGHQKRDGQAGVVGRPPFCSSGQQMVERQLCSLRLAFHSFSLRMCEVHPAERYIASAWHPHRDTHVNNEQRDHLLARY